MGRSRTNSWQLRERPEQKIYVPSGAIFGLDNLKIGQISPITKLLLKTTKSPQSLGLDVPIPEADLLWQSA